jgi:hypothetical protein
MYPERNSRYRPRLEALEARHCPSCLVYQDGETLYVAGDDGANNVSLVHEGLRRDVVQVTCDGRTLEFTGVRGVVAGLGEGNDFLSVLLGGPDTVPVSVSVDLGGGDDGFTATFKPTKSRTPLPPGTAVPGIPTWSCDVSGGPGDDWLDASVIDPNQTPEPHLINANLMFNFDGGTGADAVGIIVVDGKIAGSLDLNVTTGGGEDGTAIMLADSEVHGPVQMSVNTGGEDDLVGVLLADSLLLGPVDLRVALRGGDDVAALAIEGVQIGGALALGLDTGLGDDVVSVLVTESEEFPSQFLGPVDVAVNTGPGNDLARLGFHEVETPARRVESIHLSVDTGIGDDIASVMIQDSEDFPNPLIVDVSTGGGNDAAMIVATNPSNSSFHVSTGGGNDSVLARVGFNPQPDPPGSPLHLSLVIDAGADDDDVDVTIDLGGIRGIGLDARVLGREGDDRLALQVSGIGDPNEVQALVDGGAGFDKVLITRGVLVRHGEEVEVVG